MAIDTSRQLAHTQVRFRVRFEERLQQLYDRIVGLLMQVAESDGIIPVEKLLQIELEIEREVLRLFVANGKPYGDNGVTPQSVFAQLLNDAIIEASEYVVEANQEYVEANTDRSVWQWLALAGAGYALRGQARRVFGGGTATPNPKDFWLLKRNDLTLSEKIWQSGLRTSNRIANEINQAVRNGDSAVELSKRLEQYLVNPHRRSNRGGKNLNFDAMRLARSEITAAEGRATILSAHANPLVGGMDWALSPNHPKVDVCDDYATIDGNGSRLKEPYTLDAIPTYPPHPQCLCALIEAILNIIATIEVLAGMTTTYDAPPTTTVMNQDFIQAIIPEEAR